MQTQNRAEAAPAKSSLKRSEPLLLDIRSIFARGGSPCGSIDQAVASLKPGQDFVLVAPFEPLPLFTKLAAQGFDHESQAMPDGSWRVRFVRTRGGVPGEPMRCCCS